MDGGFYRLGSAFWDRRALSLEGNSPAARMLITADDAPRNAPRGFLASRKNSPQVNENMAFAFRI